MKRILFFLSFLTISGWSLGQASYNVAKCGAVNYVNYIEQSHPGYKNYLHQQFEIAKNNHIKSGQTYVIPVVVHIVYNPSDSIENIPDSVVYNQIEVLNLAYQRLNSDTVNLRDTFDFIAGNPNIKFKLAQIDPNGNPTTGITRTTTTHATFMDPMGFLSGDMSSVERVKSTIDGGIDPWNQAHYLNIWVCDMSISFQGNNIPALLGYATPPGGLPNWPTGLVGNLNDGVVIQYHAFGGKYLTPISAQGQTIPVKGKTTIHEVGHYLGLRHIWGDGDCSKVDGIYDTPNSIDKSTGCPMQNTCTDSIYNLDLPDMFENYMDYSDETCQNTFTQGQVDLMRGVLDNQRYDLVHGNPAAVNTNYLISSIYPNPATTNVHISITNGVLETIQIVGINGKIVKSISPPEKSSVQVNIADLESGVYFIHIKNQQGATQTKRLVKR